MTMLDRLTRWNAALAVAAVAAFIFGLGSGAVAMSAATYSWVSGLALLVAGFAFGRSFWLLADRDRETIAGQPSVTVELEAIRAAISRLESRL